MIVRPATPSDVAPMVAIYNHFVAHTTITFDEVPLDVDEMAQRLDDIQGRGFPWLVADENGALLGYAYASPWKNRSAYRYSVESSIYVGPDHARKGVGVRLYGALFPMLEARGAHAVLAGITLPNPASIGFHERFGFSKVAHLEQVGFKFGAWVDVGYWQRLL